MLASTASLASEAREQLVLISFDGAHENRLWDRSLDRSQQADWREADVPQQPYVYQTKTS